MNPSQLAAFYYNDILGYRVSERNADITTKTIEILKDNNFSDKEIIEILLKSNEESITPQIIFDRIDNGLIEAGRFYFHKELQIVPPAPVVSVHNKAIQQPTAFYHEVRLRYTIEDILAYFYNKLSIAIEMQDKQKHIVQMNYVLNFCKRFSPIQALDMILFSIDELAYNHIEAYEPFDIKQTSILSTVHNKLKTYYNEAKVTNQLQYIWRTELV